MLAVMKRPPLPKTLQRDIRNGFALRPTRSDDRSSGRPSGLLPGWQEAKAPDGRTYYHHENGEVRWDRPAAPDAQSGSSRPSIPTTAVVVAAKPVIPGVPGLAKLPMGWRMITGADGKPYYFNKKTGETSWTPPPPTSESETKDVTETLNDAKEVMKEGWRRAKQVAAVKVFKATTTDDPELDKMYSQVLQVEMQMTAIKTATEAHLASLVEMCWSAEQLAARFSDYMSEPQTVGHAPAAQAAGVWKELQ